MKKYLLVVLLTLCLIFTYSCQGADDTDGGRDITDEDNNADNSADGSEGSEMPDLGDEPGEGGNVDGDGTPDTGGNTDEEDFDNGKTPDDEGNDNGGSNDKPNVDYGSATVFSAGDKVYVVGIDKEASYISPYLFKLNDLCIETDKAYDNENNLEIIIGRNESKEASITAYGLLYELPKDSYFDMRYLVYADSGKLVIAYDENEYTPLSPLEYLSDILYSATILEGGYVALTKGVVTSGTVDLIEEQKKLDKVTLDDAWNTLKASTSEEVYEAFRLLYTMYDEELITWYASLYDSNVGGYYSNTSGMLNDGFMPIAESTNQALNFLSSSGMLKGLGSFENNIPEIMKHKIVYFCKSIQDPNGYFYNPAVSKSAFDSSAVGGRGRELGWCTNLLKKFGSAPVYDTPTGVKGDGITADEYWASLGLDVPPPVNLPKLKEEVRYSATASINTSLAVSVSKVIGTSTTVDKMSDYKTFIDYLYGLKVDTNPYSGCGAINSIYSEIAYKSEILLKKEGRFNFAESDGERYRMYDGMTLKEITIEFFNSMINPKSGLMGVTSDKNPTGTEFLFTNGLFKIIPVYNSWKIAYPDPVKAAESILTGIVSEEQTLSNICDVYNLWSGLSGIKSNAINYCDAETRNAVIETIDAFIAEHGAEMIINSYERMSAYKRPDGGFSSSTKSSITKMFGIIPIGTGEVVESNVDAIGKPTWGMVSPMFSLFGQQFVPMYTRYHYMIYLEILMEDDPLKTYFFPPVDTLEFDTMPSTQYLSVRQSSSTITVEDTDGDNSALKILKDKNTSQTVLDLKKTRYAENATSIVFETDLMISDVQKKELIAFSLAPLNAGHGNRAYRFSLKYDAADGSQIKLNEEQWTSGTNFKVINTATTDAKVGEWFKLKIVYDSSTVASEGVPTTSVYVNGKLVLVSNEVYSAVQNAYDERLSISVIMFTQLKCTLWLDNTSLKQYR